MNVIAVPYHLDERLDPSPLPVATHSTIEAELTGETPWARMSTLYEHVAEAVARTDRPTVMSADCTTALGVLAGLQRAGLEPGIVWYDAHGDFNTDETTDSGYLGGMPVALATGRGDATVRDWLGLVPIADEDVLLADARDLDPREATALGTSRVRRTRVESVPGEVLPDRPLYVHIDFDVLEPRELDGLLLPVPGGPTLHDLAKSLRGLAAVRRVAALGIACTWDANTVDGERAAHAVTAVRNALDSS